MITLERVFLGILHILIFSRLTGIFWNLPNFMLITGKNKIFKNSVLENSVMLMYESSARLRYIPTTCRISLTE